MIRIITSGGVSLDLEPESSFAIEINNPLLEDSALPAPFSTSVALPITATNCRALGYLAAMAIVPSVTKLGVILEAGGIQLFSGTLEFDSVEDGKLNYTFSGRDYESEMDVPIYERPIYTVESKWPTDIVGGKVEGVYAPLLVNEDYCGYFADLSDRLMQHLPSTMPFVGDNVKYHNLKQVSGDYVSRLCPVVSVSKIIGDALSEIDGTYSAVWPSLVVVAQYCHQSLMAESGRFSETGVDVSSFLPDMTLSEFILNLCKMLCARVYQDGRQLRMLSAASVLGGKAEATAEWDGKIADGYRMELEPGEGYSIEYENSVTKTYDDVISSQENEDGTVSEVEVGESASFREALTTFCTSIAIMGTDYVETLENKIVAYTKSQGEYYILSHAGQIYSIRSVRIPSDFTGGDSDSYVSASAITWQASLKKELRTGFEDSEEVKCGFSLIPCVPCVWHIGVKNASSSDRPLRSNRNWANNWSLAGVIEPANGSAERGTTVYIGIYQDGQLTDCGVTMGSTGDLTAPDIRPSALAAYHEPMAEWLSKDRVRLTADLNLSMADIAAFRTFRLVWFRGRKWLVARLSLTFTVGSDYVAAEGEFLSV